MEDKASAEFNSNNLRKCPYCACCFCNEVDLKRHMEVYGSSQASHIDEFRRVHGRLEHGSINGPE